MLGTNLQSTQDISLSAGNPGTPVSYADALENYRTNTDWWIVYDSFDLAESKGSALWISTRTGINLDTVTEALEGLVVLGLAKKSAQGFEKAVADFFIPRGNLSRAEKFHDHELISRQVLDHLNEDARGAIRHASFASNLDIIAEMYEKINQAILEADEKSKKLQRSQIDNVYLTSFTSVTSLKFQSNGKGAAHV